MERQEIIDGIVARCKENISLLDEKVAIAWDEIGECRCPLSMTSTNLYDAISEEVADFFCDNDLDEEEIDIDIEEEIFVKL